jgi:hypothetical protein
MKLWVLSDLHLEFGVPFAQQAPKDADVLVCPGDLLTRGVVPSIEWLASHIEPSLPVVFVAGNHEFYGGSLREGLRDAREAASRYPNLHFLENDAVDISGIRFIGGTLWTDFRLLGGDPQFAMTAAQSGMNDYRKIKNAKVPRSPAHRSPPCRFFTARFPAIQDTGVRDFVVGVFQRENWTVAGGLG